MTSITTSKQADRRHDRAPAYEPHLSLRIDQLIRQIDDALEGDALEGDALEGDAHADLLAPVGAEGN